MNDTGIQTVSEEKNRRETSPSTKRGKGEEKPAKERRKVMSHCLFAVRKGKKKSARLRERGGSFEE